MPKQIIIAHHLVLCGYGHWLPNDPRGSGSLEIRKAELSDLGPIHFGRKRIQPPRADLRTFQDAAAEKLDYDRIWFDDAKRQAVGKAFGEIIKSHRYTVWQCAVLKNHAHLCVRRHRDDADAIWSAFAKASMLALRKAREIASDHPLWANRPYKVFLDTPDDVRRIVQYIERNPSKEGLPPQQWSFVAPYDGWPYK